VRGSAMAVDRASEGRVAAGDLHRLLRGRAAWPDREDAGAGLLPATDSLGDDHRLYLQPQRFKYLPDHSGAVPGADGRDRTDRQRTPDAAAD
nr:hypothetical protein [Tanacetum cinerariifolium]